MKYVPRFLKKIEALRVVVPIQAVPILDSLAKFREIQQGCFGWDLCPDYRERIKCFTESVASLKVFCESSLSLKFTITWKLHMVCCHLEPRLTRLGQGLALVCEQAGEAIHHKFKATRARFKRSKYHPLAGKALKKSVVQWSSWALNPITKSVMQRFRDKARERRRR